MYSRPDHAAERSWIWEAYRYGRLDPDEATARLLALCAEERHERDPDDAAFPAHD